jgi:hypothetical protein
MAMGYVPSKSLDELIRRKIGRLNEVLKYTVQIVSRVTTAWLSWFSRAKAGVLW